MWIGLLAVSLAAPAVGLGGEPTATVSRRCDVAAVEQAAAQLGGTDPHAVRRSIKTLGAMDCADARQTLGALEASHQLRPNADVFQDPMVASALGLALARNGLAGPKVKAAILRLSYERGFVERADAAEALGYLGGDDTTLRLRQLVHDRSPAVAVSAIEALVRQARRQGSDGKAAEALQTLALDPSIHDADLKRDLADANAILNRTCAGPVAPAPPNNAYTRADTYFRERDYARALATVRPLAKAGHARAQYQAAFYLSLMKPPRHAEQAQWLLAAVAQGYTPAKYDLSQLYLTGQGVPVDQARGVRLLKEAAAEGDTNAINFLKMARHHGWFGLHD